MNAPVMHNPYLKGDTLTLFCNITTTNETTLDITWLNDDFDVIDDGSNRTNIENSVEQSIDNSTFSIISMLTISDLDVADSGTYDCRASIENVNTVQQQIATVTVNGNS